MDTMPQEPTPKDFSDKFAKSLTMFFRWFADTFFAKRYGHRAVILETVAGVPGMVAGMWIHLKLLQGELKPLLHQKLQSTITNYPLTRSCAMWSLP
jgi:hypothetical protein